MLSLIFAALMAVAVGDDPVCSPNGRLCVAIGWGVEEDDDGTGTPTVKLSERQSDGTFRPLRELPIDKVPESILVSDDGEAAVLTGSIRSFQHTLILHRNGEVIDIPLRRILTDNDIIGEPRGSESWSIHNDRLILTMLASIHDGPEALHEDVEIDLKSGKVLTPKHDIYPPYRVFVRSVTREDPAPKAWDGSPCKFDSANLMAVSSDAFLAAATDRIIPKSPKWGFVTGAVRVRLIVDEAGNVACLQTTPARFLADTTRDALQQWHFRRFRSANAVHIVTGELMVEFRRVEHAEWARMAPP
jgi:hypothetical protein